MRMIYAAALRSEGAARGAAAAAAGGETNEWPARLPPADELARVLLDSPLGGVVVTDRSGRVTYVSAMVERTSGWRAAEARDRPVAEVLRLVDVTTQASLPCPVARALAEEAPVRFGDASLVSRDGWRTPVQGIVVPLGTGGRTPAGVVLFFQDRTELRQLERHLAHHSQHDPLTGLVNGGAFERALAQAESAGEPCAHALLHVHLDHLAALNEASGRDAGDRLLRAVAMLLETKVRGEDVVARLGGNEFGVLLKDASREQAAALARQIVADAAAFC